jgi:hypothetical protein
VNISTSKEVNSIVFTSNSHSFTLNIPPDANPLADPILDLHNSTGALIAVNDSWMDAPNVQDIMNSGHAPTDPRESAIIATLPPGNYTAIVRGVNNITGVALVEVYDLD